MGLLFLMVAVIGVIGLVVYARQENKNKVLMVGSIVLIVIGLAIFIIPWLNA